METKKKINNYELKEESGCYILTDNKEEKKFNQGDMER